MSLNLDTKQNHLIQINHLASSGLCELDTCHEQHLNIKGGKNNEEENEN